MFPNIYTFIIYPIIGELGDATKVEHSLVCAVCERRKAPIFKYIEYRFDRWAGEDLVKAMGCYAVSKRLKQAFEQANISGMNFENMKTSKGDYFEVTSDAYAKNLPKFYRLMIEGKASGPEIWWTSWDCETCKVRHWDRTKLGTKAEGAVLTGEVGVPREVFMDSWQGHDIFNLEDPGLPIVTQRFVDLIQQEGVIGVVFHPAKWVERSK